MVVVVAADPEAIPDGDGLLAVDLELLELSGDDVLVVHCVVELDVLVLDGGFDAVEEAGFAGVGDAEEHDVNILHPESPVQIRDLIILNHPSHLSVIVQHRVIRLDHLTDKHKLLKCPELQRLAPFRLLSILHLSSAPDEILSVRLKILQVEDVVLSGPGLRESLAVSLLLGLDLVS